MRRAIEELQGNDPGALLPSVSDDALEGLKFSDCLPQTLGVHVLGMRNRDVAGVEHVLEAPTRLVSG